MNIWLVMVKELTCKSRITCCTFKIRKKTSLNCTHKCNALFHPSVHIKTCIAVPIKEGLCSLCPKRNFSQLLIRLTGVALRSACAPACTH